MIPERIIFVSRGITVIIIIIIQVFTFTEYDDCFRQWKESDFFMSVYIFTLLKSNFKLRFRRKCILKHGDVPHIEGTSNCAGHRMTAIIKQSITTCNYAKRSSWTCQNRSVRQNNVTFSLFEGPLSCSQKFPLPFFVALNQINLSRTTVSIFCDVQYSISTFLWNLGLAGGPLH